MKKKSKKDNKTNKTAKEPEEPIEISPMIIQNIPDLQTLVKKLPKSSTISSRLTASQNLLDIKNNDLHKKFIELKGLSILSNWLKEYKKSVSNGINLTRDEEFIVSNIVRLCEKMHLSINDLKTSKIGKNINSLGKALSDESELKKMCEEIVEKWREMINKNEDDNSNDNLNVNDDNNANNTNNKKILNNKTKRNNFNPTNNNNNNSNSNTNKINSKMYVLILILI